MCGDRSSDTGCLNLDLIDFSGVSSVGLANTIGFCSITVCCLPVTLPSGSLPRPLSGWSSLSTGVGWLGDRVWEVSYLTLNSSPCTYSRFSLTSSSRSHSFPPDSKAFWELPNNKRQIVQIKCQEMVHSSGGFCHPWYSRFPLEAKNVSKLEEAWWISSPFFLKLKYDSCLFSFLFIWWNQKGPKEVINVHCVRALGNALRVERMNSIVHHM